MGYIFPYNGLQRGILFDLVDYNGVCFSTHFGLRRGRGFHPWAAHPYHFRDRVPPRAQITQKEAAQQVSAQ